jgi:hypothetical protein
MFPLITRRHARTTTAAWEETDQCIASGSGRADTVSPEAGDHVVGAYYLTHATDGAVTALSAAGNEDVSYAVCQFTVVTPSILQLNKIKTESSEHKQ